MNDHGNVLIVEDDEILAYSLKKSFTKKGYLAESAKCFAEAFDVIKKFHPKYAVIDLKITGESGLKIIKKLHEFDKSIKIVMLTGYASIATTIEAIKLGASYYLAKPANVDDIIAAFNDSKKSDLLGKKTSLKNLEWEYINQALIETDFNISKTANLLGLHRRTLARKLEKRHIK